MKKKITSLILALVMLFSMIPTAVAASEEATEAAEALYELGLFRGTGTNADGTPIFDLDKVPTRNQAIIMMVRLLGKEEEALAGDWNLPFTDVVKGSTSYYYIGYAYANGLTNGTTATTYSGANPIRANQYITFVLRALGYVSGEDFKVSTAWELSDAIGMTDGSYNANTAGKFYRGDIALISEAALNVKDKSGSSDLLDMLVDAGAVDTEAARVYRTNPVRVKNVIMSESSLTMRKGDTKQLSVTVLPDNAADKSVTWESSDPSVVSVTSNGFIRALGFGTVNIYAKTSNGRSAVCKVTVQPIAVETLKLNKTSLTLTEGKSETLSATYTPSNAEDTALTWSSSNTAVAKVTNGKITAVKAGTAVITAKAPNGVSATCSVTVQGIKWYGEGMYRVGIDIPAGDYYAVSLRSNDSGYYCKYTDSSQKKIEDNDNFENYTFFRTYEGQYLKLSDCKITAIANAPSTVAEPGNGYYGEGTYRVGVDLPAGDYYAVSLKSDDSGYYCKYTDITRNKIEDNDNFDNFTFFRAYAGQYLDVNDCKITAIANAPVPVKAAASDGSYGEGTYRVGVDLPAGEYKFTVQPGEDSGYYCVYTDITYDKIADNEIFESTCYYTVTKGQYITLSDCKAVYVGRGSSGGGSSGGDIGGGSNTGGGSIGGGSSTSYLPGTKVPAIENLGLGLYLSSATEHVNGYKYVYNRNVTETKFQIYMGYLLDLGAVVDPNLSVVTDYFASLEVDYKDHSMSITWQNMESPQSITIYVWKN